MGAAAGAADAGEALAHLLLRAPVRELEESLSRRFRRHELLVGQRVRPVVGIVVALAPTECLGTRV